METSYVYFQILKWAVQQACFYQHNNDTNSFFELDIPFKNIYILKPCFELVYI